eukprot:1154496-Pelagomonas_calceolata.AAC.1
MVARSYHAERTASHQYAAWPDSVFVPARTLNVEQATWSDAISPTCDSRSDLCDAQDDVQDEQHHDVIFKCTHPLVCSLRLKYASLFSDPLSHLSPQSEMAACLPANHPVQSYDNFA